MILNNAANVMYGDIQVEKIYLGSEEIWSKGGALPPEYKRVEYIQSNGNSDRTKVPYIATDWIPSGKCGFELYGKATRDDRHVFGPFPYSFTLRTSYNDRYYYRFYYVGTSYRDNVSTGNDIYTIGIADSTDPMKKIELKTNGELYVNDTLKYSFTPTNQGSNVSNLFLLSSNNGSGSIYVDGHINDGRVELSYFKGYEFDETTNVDVLKCDMVAVKRIADNKPGMYDFVTEQFYTNVNTGGVDFVAGPEV